MGQLSFQVGSEVGKAVGDEHRPSRVNDLKRFPVEFQNAKGRKMGVKLNKTKHKQIE